MASHTLQLFGTLVLSTKYYPEDGNGSFTTTEADSFVVDEPLISMLKSVSVPGATATISLEVFHGDDTLAFKTRSPSGSPAQILAFPDGILLRNNWYVKIQDSISNADWGLQFTR